MSFSPAWLALREPADRAARNKDVRAACASHFAKHETINICDLGAGTGASLRALANALPARQRWTLVDYNAENLAAARTALTAWADTTETNDGILILRHGARTIEVHTRRQDFAENPQCWSADTDLVTASALFDLASQEWIERFVARLAADETPLLSMLTANDVIVSNPAHALDRAVVAAFHAHQTRDKGFGPSAGSAAARLLEESLRNAGYTLAVGDSPWELSWSELLQTTLDGMAHAVGETNKVSAEDIARWRAHEREHLTVGHRDVFARFI
ncbi:MAG: hypothetical protein K2P94_17090 [Rhodospirillaceae bacterium]|nr:hypothetical protein [Rhodospirillaceae bacterium]